MIELKNLILFVSFTNAVSAVISGTLSALYSKSSQIDFTDYDIIRRYTSSSSLSWDGYTPNACEYSCVSGGYTLIQRKSDEIGGLAPNSFLEGCQCVFYFWTPKNSAFIAGSFDKVSYMITLHDTTLSMNFSSERGTCTFTYSVEGISYTMIIVGSCIGTFVLILILICLTKYKCSSKASNADEKKRIAAGKQDQKSSNHLEDPVSFTPRPSSTMKSANYNTSTIRANPNLEMQNVPTTSNRPSINAGQIPIQNFANASLPVDYPAMQMLPQYHQVSNVYPQISPAQFTQMMSANPNFAMSIVSLPNAQFVPTAIISHYGNFIDHDQQQYQFPPGFIPQQQIYISSPQNSDNHQPQYPEQMQ